MVFLKYTPDHITVLLNILPRPLILRESPKCTVKHTDLIAYLYLFSFISGFFWFSDSHRFSEVSMPLFVLVGLLPTQITCKSWRLSMGFTPSEQASHIASSSSCWVRGIYNVLPLSFTSIPWFIPQKWNLTCLFASLLYYKLLKNNSGSCSSYILT